MWVERANNIINCILIINSDASTLTDIVDSSRNIRRHSDEFGEIPSSNLILILQSD